MSQDIEKPPEPPKPTEHAGAKQARSLAIAAGLIIGLLVVLYNYTTLIDAIFRFVVTFVFWGVVAYFLAWNFYYKNRP